MDPIDNENNNDSSDLDDVIDKTKEKINKLLKIQRAKIQRKNKEYKKEQEKIRKIQDQKRIKEENDLREKRKIQLEENIKYFNTTYPIMKPLIDSCRLEIKELNDSLNQEYKDLYKKYQDKLACVNIRLKKHIAPFLNFCIHHTLGYCICDMKDIDLHFIKTNIINYNDDDICNLSTEDVYSVNPRNNPDQYPKNYEKYIYSNHYYTCLYCYENIKCGCKKCSPDHLRWD